MTPMQGRLALVTLPKPKISSYLITSYQNPQDGRMMRPYAGTESDPIQFPSPRKTYSTESTNRHYNHPSTPVYPVVTEEMMYPFMMNTSAYEGNVEPEEEYDSAAATYQYLDSYFTMTNLALEP